LPQPFWRRASGLPEVVLLVAVEAVLLVLLFIVVANVVIPIAAPPVGVPTPSSQARPLLLAKAQRPTPDGRKVVAYDISRSQA
jgi:hypothetical protein